MGDLGPAGSKTQGPFHARCGLKLCLSSATGRPFPCHGICQAAASRRRPSQSRAQSRLKTHTQTGTAAAQPAQQQRDQVFPTMPSQFVHSSVALVQPLLLGPGPRSETGSSSASASSGPFR